MGFVKEFKDFAMKGNLVDMAVAVVMATAFGKVVSSFIDGMVMPAIGMATGGQDFSKMKYIMKPAELAADGTEAVAEVAIKYGAFVTQIIEFVIIALVVFIIIRAVNNLKKKEEAAPAGPTPTEALLTEIRDALKK